MHWQEETTVTTSEKGITVRKERKIDLHSIAIYIIAVAIFVMFAILAEMNGRSFLSLSNIRNIITQSAVISVIAIGQTMVIITGGIDLSVGSVVGFVGITGGLMIKAGIPVLAAVFLTLVIGIMVGLINGLLISYGRIPAFITTLAMMQIFRGLCMLVNSGKPVAGFPEGLTRIMGTEIFGIPISIFYVFLTYLIMMTLMAKTRFGRYVYAVGGNREAAKLSGVKVQKIELITYALAGLFAALGGVMLLSRLSYADPNAGISYEMNAIAATVIGGTAMSGGKGKLGNTFVGAIILGMLTTGLQILNVPVHFQSIITGMAVAGAVYLDKIKERKE